MAPCGAVVNLVDEGTGWDTGGMRFLGNRPDHDLTYADVFMVPNHSTVGSRLEVDLTTPDRVGTTIPIVVATLTVAEALSLLTKRAHGVVVVVEDGTPVGVVTDGACQGVDRFTQLSQVM